MNSRKSRKRLSQSRFGCCKNVKSSCNVLSWNKLGRRWKTSKLKTSNVVVGRLMQLVDETLKADEAQISCKTIWPETEFDSKYFLNWNNLIFFHKLEDFENLVSSSWWPIVLPEANCWLWDQNKNEAILKYSPIRSENLIKMRKIGMSFSGHEHRLEASNRTSRLWVFDCFFTKSCNTLVMRQS